MMFYLSKILWGLFQPTSLIGAFFLMGLFFAIRGRVRSAFTLFAGAAALFIILGFSPLADWLVESLEERASAMAARNLDGASGIIVLGGAFKGGPPKPGDDVSNGSGGRMTEAVKLALQYPALPVVFSGGRGELIEKRNWPPEADMARHFFEDFSIVPPRLRLEDHSRNTFENAALTAKLVQPKPDEKWILITSAFHMPRAKALFEAQGFHILPRPVDYRVSKAQHGLLAKVSDSLYSIDLATKEWVGIAVYWLRGDIARL